MVFARTWLGWLEGASVEVGGSGRVVVKNAREKSVRVGDGSLCYYARG